MARLGMLVVSTVTSAGLHEPNRPTSETRTLER